MKAKSIEEFEKEIGDLVSEEQISSEQNRSELLCEHVHEYLERWLAFANFDKITIEATLHNDVFRCLQAGINLIDRNLKLDQSNINTDVFVLWSEFKNTIEWIEHSPNRDDLKLIEVVFIAFAKKAFSKHYTISIGNVESAANLKLKGIQ